MIKSIKNNFIEAFVEAYKNSISHVMFFKEKQIRKITLELIFIFIANHKK